MGAQLKILVSIYSSLVLVRVGIALATVLIL